MEIPSELLKTLYGKRCILLDEVRNARLRRLCLLSDESSKGIDRVH
jgi:hypothetical protein